MIRDARLEIRLSKDLLEMVRVKARQRGSTITEYIEELVMVNLGLEGSMVPAPGSRVLVQGPVVGDSATSEYQRKLELGKSLIQQYKPHPGQAQFNDVLPPKTQGIILDLDMEEAPADNDPVIEYNDDYSQGRVVGRHKK